MKRFLSCASLFLVFISCNSQPVQEDIDLVEEDVVEETTQNDPEVNEEQVIFATFTLNTQEFLTPDLSQEVIDGVLELHMRYDLPVDIYFADFIVQELDETDVFQELAANDLVALSYHIRAPLPYAGGYTDLDLESMSEEELYELYMEYETHTVDPLTGELMEAPGGYDYLKELIGYAPYAAPMKDGGTALVDVYADLGAQFTVSHDAKSYGLGDKIHDLYYRPETYEVRLFESTEEEVEEQLDRILSRSEDEPVFINFKIHDKDFFADASAWSLMYVHKKPPYNEKSYFGEVNYLTEEEQERVWDLYEFSLDYVRNHPEIQAVNLEDVSEIIGL